MRALLGRASTALSKPNAPFPSLVCSLNSLEYMSRKVPGEDSVSTALHQAKAVVMDRCVGEMKASVSPQDDAGNNSAAERFVQAHAHRVLIVDPVLRSEMRIKVSQALASAVQGMAGGSNATSANRQPAHRPLASSGEVLDLVARLF